MLGFLAGTTRSSDRAKDSQAPSNPSKETLLLEDIKYRQARHQNAGCHGRSTFRGAQNCPQSPISETQSQGEPPRGNTKEQRQHTLESAKRSLDPTNTSSGYDSSCLSASHPLIYVDIHLASFFSQHRPISVSHVIPPASSTEAFGSLFNQPKVVKSKHDEVIYTLSSAVDTLDQAVSQYGQQSAPEDHDLRTAVTQASSANAEAHVSSRPDTTKPIQINLQELAKNFRPFVPPPSPVPLAAMKEAAKEAAKERERATKTTAWTSKLTVYVNVHPDGRNTYKTFTTPLKRTLVSLKPPPRQKYEEPQQQTPCHLPSPELSRTFLGRMLERQITYEDRQDQKFRFRIPRVHTLSVRSQRKLKMKKHKYKKLLKRTRNLRKRLGQA